MSATQKNPASEASDDATASIPQTTPRSIGYGHPEYHFVQAILEMQKSLGENNALIKSVSNRVESIDTRLDKLEEKVSGITHKLYAAGVILAILIAVGGFIIDKALDIVISHIATIQQSAK